MAGELWWGMSGIAWAGPGYELRVPHSLSQRHSAAVETAVADWVHSTWDAVGSARCAPGSNGSGYLSVTTEMLLQADPGRLMADLNELVDQSVKAVDEQMAIEKVSVDEMLRIFHA